MKPNTCEYFGWNRQTCATELNDIAQYVSLSNVKLYILFSSIMYWKTSAKQSILKI